MSWTLEKIRSNIKQGYYFSCESDHERHIKTLITHVTNDGIRFAEDVDYYELNGYCKLDDKYWAKFTFYDQNMNLIEPPKDKEYVTICEFWNCETFEVKLLNEVEAGYPFLKVPNGKRYKFCREDKKLVDAK